MKSFKFRLVAGFLWLHLGLLQGCSGPSEMVLPKDGGTEPAVLSETGSPQRDPALPPQIAAKPSSNRPRSAAEEGKRVEVPPRVTLDVRPVGGLTQVAAPQGAEVQVLHKDPSGCRWVESRASVAFGEHDTKHQALAQAVSMARAKAIENFLGVKVQDRFLNFQQESSLRGQVRLTESLLRVTQLGRILKEKQLAAGPMDVGDCRGCQFGVHIQACIAPLRDQSDKGFRITLTLSRTRFVEGDEGSFEVTTSREAYAYIYSVDLDWNAGLLFPNIYDPDNRIKAGGTLTYPSEVLKRRGVRVRAQLPAGTSVSAETIRVIASKTPLPRYIYDPAAADPTRRSHARDTHGVRERQGTGSFLNLLDKLHASDHEWVEDVQAFTIYKK